MEATYIPLKFARNAQVNSQLDPDINKFSCAVLGGVLSLPKRPLPVVALEARSDHQDREGRFLANFCTPFRQYFPVILRSEPFE
jgi:hypothetical protein